MLGNICFYCFSYSAFEIIGTKSFLADDTSTDREMGLLAFILLPIMYLCISIDY